MRNEAISVIVAKHVPAASGAASMVLFGVPFGVLIAAFLGAILSFYFRKGMPETRIPTIVFGVITIAFAGAWLSLALPHVDWLGIGAMAAKVDESVRAGLCALVFQSVWNAGNRFIDRKAETA